MGDLHSMSMGTDPPLLIGYARKDVIPETQLNQTHDNGKVYKDILASIDLYSPTSSQELKSIVPRKEQALQVAYTPIRSGAASNMALGKQALTPRQSRIWEYRSKSPLEG